MTKKPRILFIGNFLSTSKGTIGPSEKLKLYLKAFEIIQASSFENKALRLCDFIVKSSFYSYKTIHIDVYSGQAQYFAFLVVFIAKFRKKKIILNLRGGKLSKAYNTNPKTLSYCLKSASAVITPSTFLQNYFTALGYKVNYLPNFIDLQKFQYKDTSARIPYSMLWVRAFTDIYEPAVAIKALFEVRKTIKDATLSMIGPDNGLLNQCKQIIDILGLHNSVTIIGPVANDKLMEYYKTHAVFINTTKYESFGMAVLEAAACGIPIVSTKVGELPLLWEEDKEILFSEVGDVNGFTNQILKVFQDSGLSTLLSANAREKAKKFDWLIVKKSWRDLLNGQV